MLIPVLLTALTNHVLAPGGKRLVMLSISPRLLEMWVKCCITYSRWFMPFWFHVLTSCGCVYCTQLFNLFYFRNTTPLKRQRWKSFRLRDDYEEIAYVKMKKVKKRSTQSLGKESVQKVKKRITQSFDEEIMQKVKKQKMESFDEETKQKVMEEKTQSFNEENMQKVKKMQSLDKATLSRLFKPLMKGKTCICLFLDIMLCFHSALLWKTKGCVLQVVLLIC